MYIAIYVRVSSTNQREDAQILDLKRWAAAQDEEVKWYRDKFTGKTMDRPGWQNLNAALLKHEVSTIVVWRLDRLGRTARGLTALFDDLQARRVSLVSLRDGIDLSTPTGRLMANVIASVAQYETEIRGERQRAGNEAARAANGGKCPWGGSKLGRRIRLTREKERAIRRADEDGEGVTAIAKAVGLSRQTVYRVLANF